MLCRHVFKDSQIFKYFHFFFFLQRVRIVLFDFLRSFITASRCLA
jgi:hypothetical protein